jgi:hypothetical protein
MGLGDLHGVAKRCNVFVFLRPGERAHVRYF